MSNSASEAATADCSNTTAPPEQLCYVHCTLCDTLLAVSVPWMNMYKTVTVRCGHCSNLLPVNLRALLLGQPFPAAHLHSSSHQFFPPTAPSLNITGDQVANMTPNYPMSETTSHANHFSPSGGRGGGTTTELPRPPATNRPPEKRQRVPSAYNRFIKEEIQRLKARNPEISHREAFSAAAKNWAHFPHIHFGLMHDQTVRNAP